MQAVRVACGAVGDLGLRTILSGCTCTQSQGCRVAAFSTAAFAAAAAHAARIGLCIEAWSKLTWSAMPFSLTILTSLTTGNAILEVFLRFRREVASVSMSIGDCRSPEAHVPVNGSM